MPNATKPAPTTLPVRNGAVRDFVARRILLPLQTLDFRNQTSSSRFERRQLLEIRIGVEPAVSIGRAHLFEPIAQEGRINHGLDPNGSPCSLSPTTAG